MLNNVQRDFINKNIRLVYAYCKRYGIKDEDDIADLICEFCRVVEKDEYDPTKGALGTFYWNVLKNYQLIKYKHNMALCRTIPESFSIIYLDSFCQSEEGETSMQEFVSMENDCFNEVEVDIILRSFYDICIKADSKINYPRTITYTKLFKELIWCYYHNNGKVNCNDIAKKFNVTRQMINIRVHELIKILKKEIKYDQ